MKNGLFIDEDKNKFWYKDSILHREEGPAVELAYGYKSWFLNGKRHRLNGPAVEHSNGDKVWWYEGQYIECSTQEEFEHLIKLKVLW